jgi:hypothetical protein
MDASSIGRSQAETRRLAELVGRLTEDDLGKSLGGGWTVKAALAHLAHWDRFAAAVLEGWSADGFQPVASSPDHVNSASLPDWLTLPSQYVLSSVVAAAKAADDAVQAVTPELASAIEAGGRARTLDRSVHRKDHLDQIEAALGA